MIETRGVTRYFGAKTAVEDLDLRVADHAHWRVLNRALLRYDLRSSSVMQMAGSAEKSGMRVSWRILFVYGLAPWVVTRRIRTRVGRLEFTG